MKAFRHPIHPMIAHFPSALFPMELLYYILAYYTHKIIFLEISYYTLISGVCMGWLAVILGAIDLISIPAEKEKTLKKALVHGSMNTTVVIIYSVIAWAMYNTPALLHDASLYSIVLKFCILTVMVVGNYIGAELIYKDKIGIE